MNHVERLKEIFETTIDNGLKYEGNHVTPEYYNLFCQAASSDALYKVLGNNICMFNYTFENEDAIMMLFSIPINSDDVGAKSIAERVMKVITEVENCFITTD
jgi:phosphodiesterase/alkaline phosphatase D-like protein